MWQKLDEPILFELDSVMEFIIITEINLSEVKNCLMFGRGKKFSFEDGYVTEYPDEYEIQFNLKENGHFNVRGD